MIEAESEEQRRQKLGLVKQLDKHNFVKKRRNQRIIRYKRFSPINDKVNWRRVQVMLFHPWRNEQKELECDKKCAELYETGGGTIALNKMGFESAVANEFDRAQENVDREIEEHYELLNASEIVRAADAHNYLMQNTFLGRSDIDDRNSQNDEPNREEIEDEFGYHGELQRADDICRVTAERDEEEMRMPEIWGKER